jgi:uncharacterized protein YuzE
MDIRIDTEADAAYIKLRAGHVAYSEEVAEGYVLDYNEEGKVLGIEVLHLSKQAEHSVGVHVPEQIWAKAQ